MCGPWGASRDCVLEGTFQGLQTGQPCAQPCASCCHTCQGEKDGASGGAMSRGTRGGQPATRWVCLHIASGKYVSCHQQQPQDSP